jgi:hypothetical protein
VKRIQSIVLADDQIIIAISEDGKIAKKYDINISSFKKKRKTIWQKYKESKSKLKVTL